MANITRRNDQPRSVERTRGGWEPARMLRDLFGWDPFAEMIPAFTGREGGFVPSFEVKETKDGFVFTADLPGVKDEDVDVTLTGNRLTISGKREAEEQDEGERFYAYERSFGTFTRTFTLPDDVDANRVDAQLKNGVLRIVVAKTPERQPKKIELKSGQPSTAKTPKA